MSPGCRRTHRVPFKTGVGSFSWQGVDWRGRQPGCDRGGALTAGQVAFVCYFWPSEGEGRAGSCLSTKGAHTHLPHPHRLLFTLSSSPVMSQVDVYGRFCVCKTEGSRNSASVSQKCRAWQSAIWNGRETKCCLTHATSVHYAKLLHYSTVRLLAPLQGCSWVPIPISPHL